MSIDTGIPTSLRTPGSYINFDLTSAMRGLVALTRRVALIGMKSSAGSQAVATPVQVFSDDQADTLFGKGSELALMIRRAFRAGRKAGNLPEIYGVAVAAPSGASQTKTFTMTGPATASGTLRIRVAGRVISIGVNSGDTATVVASAIDSALDALNYDLPVTSGSAAGVVTVTFVTTGVNGADLVVSVDSDSVPAGLTCVAATATAGTGAYDITASLDTLVDKHYHAIVIANHASTDITDLAAHTTARSASGVKKWTYGFIAENASLAASTTLASSANSEYAVIVSAEAYPNMTGEIAAAVAVTRMAQEDPTLSISGVELDLDACPAVSVYTPGAGGEVESALSGGTTPLSVNAQGRVYVVRLFTSKTTVSSVAFDKVRDFGVMYGLTRLSEELDALIEIFRANPENKKATADMRKRLRSVLLEKLRFLEAKPYQWVQNVEAHKDELQVEGDPSVPQRTNVDLPASIVPGAEQTAMKVRLFVE